MAAQNIMDFGNTKTIYIDKQMIEKVYYNGRCIWSTQESPIYQEELSQEMTEEEQELFINGLPRYEDEYEEVNIESDFSDETIEFLKSID